MSINNRHRVSHNEYNNIYRNKAFINPYDLEVIIIGDNYINFGKSMACLDDIESKTMNSMNYISISRKLADKKRNANIKKKFKYLKSKSINICNNSNSKYMERELQLSEEIDIVERIALKDLKIYK